MITQNEADLTERTALGAALFRLANHRVRQVRNGLHLTAMTTLAHLEESGSRRITDLALTQDVTQPSMTILIKNLEGHGLVTRRHDPQDGRAALISLTAEGAALLAARRGERVEDLALLVDRLTTQERAALVAALPALEHLSQLQQEARGSASNAAPRSRESSAPLLAD